MIFIQGILASFTLNCLFIYGPKTGAQMISRFENFSMINLSSDFDISQLEFYLTPSLIIDATFEEFNLITVDLISSFFRVPYITLAKPFSFHNSHNRVYAQSSINEDADALANLIKNLKWDTFTALVSNYHKNILILEQLKKRISSYQINSFIYEPSISENMMSTLVKRFMKAEGVRNFLILDSGESLELCIKILKSTKMSPI